MVEPDFPPRPESSAADAVGDQAQVSPPQQRTGIAALAYGLWVLIARLLLLGAGISAAWLLGLLAAQIYPARTPEPPLQEVALRQGHRTLRRLRQLPQWWRGDLSANPPVGLPTAVPTPIAPPTAAPELTPQQRQSLEDDLTALVDELDAMKNRISDLEAQLGQSPSRAPLEMRLRSLQRQLNPPAAEDTTAETPTSEEAAPTDTSLQQQDPLFRLATYRVTLPADLLFAIDQAILQPNARPLLDTILPDLSRYQGATILIGSHADNTLAAEASRQLTFQQAMAIRSYLMERLGEEYHWVAVGYGHRQPLVAEDDELGQQRNRRVEIAILLP